MADLVRCDFDPRAVNALLGDAGSPALVAHAVGTHKFRALFVFMSVLALNAVAKQVGSLSVDLLWHLELSVRKGFKLQVAHIDVVAFNWDFDVGIACFEEGLYLDVTLANQSVGLAASDFELHVVFRHLEMDGNLLVPHWHETLVTGAVRP